jgi:competence CoiA-like predicted nuclease
MEFAFNNQHVRVKAERGIDATCPLCCAPCVAKCGNLIIHHWAHKTKEDCDNWWEPETEWHRSWKRLFPDEQTEVTMAGHRADIVRTNGQIVELQHSSISIEEIAEREAAYVSMLWLFDGRDLKYNRFLLRERDNGRYYSFRWLHPRKHYGFCKQSVYIDLGGMIFKLEKLHLESGAPYGGWGTLILPSEFKTKLSGKDHSNENETTISQWVEIRRALSRASSEEEYKIAKLNYQEMLGHQS